MPVISRMRGTAAPETASSTWPPSARARLCASTSACIPAESQNRVRVRSTTSVPGPFPAALSSGLHTLLGDIQAGRTVPRQVLLTLNKDTDTADNACGIIPVTKAAS